MLTDSKSIDYDRPLSILIGENGSGKSQALGDIAEGYISRNYSVIAIANCPFDKFRDKGKRYFFMGGRYGQSFIGVALKQVLASIAEPSVSRYNVGVVLSYLGYDTILGVCQEESQSRIDWHDLSGSQSNSEFNKNSKEGSWSLNLHKDELHNWPAIFLKRKGRELPMERASSGEIQLITTFAFIASNITHRTAILIDEPENSLHPRWQRKYIDQLLDLFEFYRPKLIIATHAPVIVTAVPCCNVSYSVYRLSNNELQEVYNIDEGMEQVLWEVFKMLTPRSAFLSRYLTDLIHKKRSGSVSGYEFNVEFDELYDAAWNDPKQRQLISHVKALADE